MSWSARLQCPTPTSLRPQRGVLVLVFHLSVPISPSMPYTSKTHAILNYMFYKENMNGRARPNSVFCTQALNRLMSPPIGGSERSYGENGHDEKDNEGVCEQAIALGYQIYQADRRSGID